MLFRQLFDPETSTYTYLLADPQSRDALLIDPVLERMERDLRLLSELGLRLRYTVETHVHADHITSAANLRQQTGSQVVLGERSGVPAADQLLADGDSLVMGGITLTARATPGHTDGCTSWYCAAEGVVFTGDTLLIRGCGRTDFQQGDAYMLWKSVHEQLFTLPDETRVYPGHDYQGRTVTTIDEEKRCNPRLGQGMTVESFAALMAGLNLAYPKKIDIAVPANLTAGQELPRQEMTETSVTRLINSRGRQDAGLWIGDGI